MKKQILVVDDSDALRQSIYYILHEHGYIVVEAQNKEEGFQKLRSGHFDLIIADDHKPFFDSEDFARNVKELQGLADLPVLSISYQKTPDFESSVSVIDGCIMKPFSSDTLLHEIKRLCG